MAVPAPFLRWAGGKRQLLPLIRSGMPAEFDQYFEPFVGGGAVFFSLQLPGSRCTVNDVNPDLLAVYRALQFDPTALIAKLRRLGKDVSQDEFYRIRASRPRTELDRAARMVYLNRTCFNGLYRVNSKGGFNVPWGKLKNAEVCNAELLNACAGSLRGARILEGSFADAVSGARSGDFVYLDPPYIPLSPTASFSKYAKDDFTQPDQEQLAATIDDLTARGVRVMLSNSDTPLTRDIYSSLTLHTVGVSRSISAAAASRTRVNEVIGVNYPAGDMADAGRFLERVGASRAAKAERVTAAARTAS